MATPYLSHWALWPGTLHLAFRYSFDSTGVSCPDAYTMALSATTPGQAWTGQMWGTAGSLCPLWSPRGARQAQVLREEPLSLILFRTGNKHP